MKYSGHPISCVGGACQFSDRVLFGGVRETVPVPMGGGYLGENDSTRSAGQRNLLLRGDSGDIRDSCDEKVQRRYGHPPVLY